MKKTLAIILILVLLATMLMACGKETRGIIENDETEKLEIERKDTWVSDKKITLTVMSPIEAYTPALEELSIFRTLEEMTNIHFEFDTGREGMDERKNLALATGDVPDIFMLMLSKEDMDRYGPQGVLIPIDEYLNKEDTPNILRAFEEDPTMRMGALSADGHMYALPSKVATATIGSWLLSINMEWVDNLGLKVPTTVDDFYEVLKVFKSEDPAGGERTIPLAGWDGLTIIDGTLLPAFGEAAQSFSVADNGKIVFNSVSENYKAYLQYIKKLYDEKLLDQLTFSQTNEEYLAKTAEQIVGVLAGSLGQADYNKFQYIPPLTSEYNDKPFSSTENRVYVQGRFAITNVNKYIKESLRWVDLSFTEAGKGVNGISGMALWIGQQGVHWDYNEKGELTYLFEAEGDLTEIQTLRKYHAPYSGGGPGLVVTWDTWADPYSKWVCENTKKYIFPYIKPESWYPPVTFSKEEANRLSVIDTDIDTYVKEMKANFVIGKESFDNWSSYVNELQKMGLDESIAIRQAAYDRFMNQ